MLASRNFVTFPDLAGDETLYKRIFNTLHVANGANFAEILTALETYQADFDFKTLTLDEVLTGAFDSLVFNVTENCNLRCGYCIFSGLYEDARVHSKNKMDFDTAKLAIDFFIQNSKPRPFILFYGGEPLLNQRVISEIVEYTERNSSGREPVFGLTTNFTLARRHLDFLINHNFLITVSLDGSKDLHDLWRKDIKGRGTFDRIYKTVELVAQTNPEYYGNNVAFSVTVTDPSQLTGICEFFSTPLFQSNPVRIQSVERRFLNEDLFNYARRATEGKRQLAHLAEIYAHNIINGEENNTFLRGLFDGIVHPIYARSVTQLPDELSVKGMCKPGFRKLFVDTDGTYYMCEKIGRRFDLGDVFNGFDLGKSIEAYNAYVDVKRDICGSCWAVRLCDSCAVSAKSLNGVSEQGQMQTCGSIKEKILLGLGIYSYLLKNDKNKYYETYYSEITMEV